MHPKLLTQTNFQLTNNFQRLQEVGFLEVTAYRLANTQQIMSKSVHFNQCFNFLPPKINVIQNIFDVANIQIPPIDETVYDRDMKLETVHKMALKQYLLIKIGNSRDVDKMFHNYPAIKSRSLQSLVKVTALLENAYNKQINELPKYSLLMQPEEIQELLEVGTFCGTDVRRIMFGTKKCNMSRIKEIQSICRSYKIPDYVMGFYAGLFHMNFDTLRDRLNTIAKLKRSNEFFHHIDIGRVILALERIRIHFKSMGLDFDAIFDDTFLE